MPRPGIVTAAVLAVLAFVAAPSAGGDRAEGPRRRTRPEITDLRVGDGGVVVTSEDAPDVEVRFRLTSKRPANVRVGFEIGVDRGGNGYVDDGDFRSASVGLPAPEGTSERRSRRRRTRVLRLHATPEGVEHVVVWRVRNELAGGRFPAVTQLQRRERPDAFDLVAFPPPVLRLTAARADSVSRAFEYDGDAPLALTFDAVQPGPSLRLVGSAADADSEDLNGNGRLDPLDGEDRNGDGILRVVGVEVLAWWVRVPQGFDPAALEPDELLRLDWRPCTLDLDLGPVVPAYNYASTFGHYVSFLWNTEADVPGDPGPFLLGMRVHRPYVVPSGFEVFSQPVTIGP